MSARSALTLAVAALFVLPARLPAQSPPPDSYFAIRSRTIYHRPPAPALGPAGHRFADPTFRSRLLRVTDGSTRPGVPESSYSTPSAAHQLAWNATSDRFYVRSLDGWFIPYNFNAASMTASRILPAPDGNGGLVIPSQAEPQFSFVSRDIIYTTVRDQTDPNHDFPVVQAFNLATSAQTTLVNLRQFTDVNPDTYSGALSSSATAPERVSVMFAGSGQDRHFKVAVFEVANPAATVKILNTKDSLIFRGKGAAVKTSSTLGFLLHHAWLDQSGRWLVLYPVSASPAPFVVWNLETDTFTSVTTRASGHDALGYGWQVNQDCCSANVMYDGAQWQLRHLGTPRSSVDLISPTLTPQEVYIADHTSWNNARPDRRVPVLSSLYRYYKNSFNTAPWRPWDDEIVAIQTSAPGAATVWRFAHHHSDITMDNGTDGTYFWYQPHANISPNGRWALFTSNWDKTLGLASGSEPEGRYRTDVFIVRLTPALTSDTAFVAGGAIKAAHFAELREGIDIVRGMSGLPSFPWTDPELVPGVTPVKAVHVTDMQKALTEVYATEGLPLPAFQPIVARQTVVRAAHLEEIRDALVVLANR